MSNNIPELEEITPEEARDMLWSSGNISELLLDNLQKKMIDGYRNSANESEITFVLSRQTGKCIFENDKIATPCGSVPIKDIKVGDVVYGYDSDGKISPTEVRQVHKQGLKRVVELKHRGRVIATTTPEHRFLAYSPTLKKYSEKTAKELINSSHWKIKREYFDNIGGDVYEPHAYALGALLGDGYGKFNNTNYQISISSETSHIPEAVAKELDCNYWKAAGNNFSWILSNNERGNRNYGRDNPFEIELYDLWCKGRLAHEKICEYEKIRKWTRESQIRFIAGLLDTDGCIMITGRHDNELKFSLSMQSESVIRCVQNLFLDLWQIDLCYYLDNRSKYKNGPCHTVYSNNNFCIKRFLKETSPWIATDRKKYKEEYSSFPEYNHISSYVGVVAGREFEAETYDIGINNGTHLYSMANGLITHNSFGFATLAIEECIRRPEIVILYIAPTLKMAKRILKNNLNQILKNCPKELRPAFKTQDSEYLFQNGSRIILCGFNAGEIEGVRGNTCHLVMMDECGFMDEAEFEYGVNSVIYPTLNVTKGTLMMCSTLPKSATHPYWMRVLKARMENRCIEGTIYDCPRYTQEDIDKFAKRVGGYDTIDFRREYMNEMITDEERAVIPEATKERMANMTKDKPRPPHFDSYISMDIGFRDYTAILFGYYDFLKNQVVIEDEVILKGVKVTTAAISEAIKAKELQHWGHKKPYLRVADNNNLILLNELSQHPYNLPIIATAKDNREAAINKLRLLVQKEQLVIHPRCVQLLQHIQHATWNKKRTEFDRDPINGHFDLLAALIYFVRNVQFGKNPYPQEWLLSYEAFSIDGLGGTNKPKNEFEKAMVDLFNPLRKRR